MHATKSLQAIKVAIRALNPPKLPKMLINLEAYTEYAGGLSLCISAALGELSRLS
jgi:hypothetical protein